MRRQQISTPRLVSFSMPLTSYLFAGSPHRAWPQRQRTLEQAHEPDGRLSDDPPARRGCRYHGADRLPHVPAPPGLAAHESRASPSSMTAPRAAHAGRGREDQVVRSEPLPPFPTRAASAERCCARMLSVRLDFSRVCPNRSADLSLLAPAQPHSSAATRTGCAFVDELDPSSLQRRDDPRQRLDHPADRAVARFHSLNRRERYPRCLR